jgi:hypothetical protein
MTNKDKYREICKNQPSIPIFSQYWWLDAVAGVQNWDVALVDRGGEIVGAMPYYFKQTYRMTRIIMPALTQSLGPWLNYPMGQKYSTRLSFEKECFSELIDLLPPFDSFYQKFHYSVSNWLPFFWNGFQQSSRYTYVLENIGDLESIFDGFRTNIKTDIRKASKSVNVACVDDGIDEFYRVNALTFQRQNITTPYSLSFVKNLDAACKEQRCRKIFIARGINDGAIHAVAYIIWDKTSAYYLMGGGNPHYRNSGATSLLLWSAIQFASTVAKQFDFEGSMIEPVERFFRAFGAVQKNYFEITKLNSRLLKILRCIRYGWKQ